MAEQQSADAELGALKLPDGREVVAPNVDQAVVLWKVVNEDAFYLEAIEGLAEGDVVFDIGGNIGFTALLFADRAPGVRVVSVEPAPPCYEAMRENIARHVPGGTAVQAAVGRAPGTMELTYYPESPVNSTLYADIEETIGNHKAYMRTTGMREEFIQLHHESLVTTFEKVVVTSVDVVTVGELAERHGVEEIALLKIDVERAETDVLDGVPGPLWPRIRRVCVEVHDNDGRLEQVKQLLTAKGLRVRVGQEEVLAGTAVHMVLATRD
ncbi:FkbM family methyltransferase [Streptomyces celluloflavus]|uniref:FkbM family methyltransferase n=1 Tax=Streptomyces celluloflavus TaxID=58344 RepID=UPI003656BECF